LALVGGKLEHNSIGRSLRFRLDAANSLGILRVDLSRAERALPEQLKTLESWLYSNWSAN
jgi:hypothetical protein